MRTQEEWNNIFGMADSGYLHTQMYESGREMIYKMMAHGIRWEGANVLDIGSANGRFAAALTEQKIHSYVGIEPIANCVAFCKQAFAEYEKFSFDHIDLRNSMYNPRGVVDPKEYIFPYDDKSFDIIIVCSVFTHLQSLDEARNYMVEIYRMLAPGGCAYLTWFRSPPNLLNFKDIERTTYKECDIINMLKGFEVLYTESGNSDHWHDQWQMFVKKT